MFPDSGEHRRYQRHKLLDTFVVNQQGVCSVLNLSPGGVSLGCPTEREIPERLVIDIVDDKGLHLLDLPIDKVWVAKNQDLNTTSIYGTLVGAKFDTDLSPYQQSTIKQLFEFLSKNNPQ